jgi:hypothetical protein
VVGEISKEVENLIEFIQHRQGRDMIRGGSTGVDSAGSEGPDNEEKDRKEEGDNIADRS